MMLSTNVPGNYNVTDECVGQTGASTDTQEFKYIITVTTFTSTDSKKPVWVGWKSLIICSGTAAFQSGQALIKNPL